MWSLFLIWSCLLPASQAAFLWECEGVIISQVPNPNTNCSEFVHCEGEDSYYCNGDCTEPVECFTQNNTSSSSTARTTIIEESITNSTETPTLPTSVSTSSTTSAPSISTTESTDIRILCKLSGQNGVYPYPANENYYYQCIGGYLLLQQCPQYFRFDVKQGQCIKTQPYRI